MKHFLLGVVFELSLQDLVPISAANKPESMVALTGLLILPSQVGTLGHCWGHVALLSVT